MAKQRAGQMQSVGADKDEKDGATPPFQTIRKLTVAPNGRGSSKSVYFSCQSELAYIEEVLAKFQNSSLSSVLSTLIKRLAEAHQRQMKESGGPVVAIELNTKVYL